VSAAVDELVESLLHEGYALYPYTPGATKNATPTPFGIVYPPAYAERSESTFDHLQVECFLEVPGELSAELRFLQATGQRHQAVERRVVLSGPGTEELAHVPLRGRAELSRDGDRVRVRLDNLTELPTGDLDRRAALKYAFLSTHVVLRVAGGRFASPLERAGESVNSWPVLATREDDTVLGAAIVLPDHPQIAPQSRGDLFDNTEIEEALLLHVHALSDSERAQIGDQDPAVREMIERAAAATPEELMRLHAVMRPAEEDVPGEQERTVDGRVFRRGAKVVLRLGRDGDPHDALLDGRLATIERIYEDYDGRVHLGVTVDDDPGSDVMRASGRFTFFKPEEVELREPT
jgi:hypothetical protein